MNFKNRKQAGKQLAEELKEYDLSNPFVFGLARGGVPVAREVAKELEARLDVLVPRKLGVPGHEEFAFGAIAPRNVKVINTETVKRLDLSESQIEEVIQKEKKEMNRRIKKFRGEREEPDLQKCSAIIVDDGLATGATALASIRYVRKLDPKKLVLAVPVGSKDAVEQLGELVDELICLHVPSFFNAVGQWYINFGQTSDEEVIQLLDEFRD